MASTCSSSLRKSSTSRMLRASSCVKKVVLVVTRKPRRLASRDGDDGRSAFLDRVDALLNRQPTRQDILGMLDLAAAGTGQVTLVERLELQHQRELLPPPQSLLDDIRRDPQILAHRDGHSVPPAGAHQPPRSEERRVGKE